MNGIINILKPPGMTSFDVVAYLRRLLGIKRIGHAGTLDPMAAGVLPVCVGKATGAVEFLIEKDKHYRTELTLGITTDTQDVSGEILSKDMPECSDSEIESAVRSFVGKYMQTPPMYSALKIGGKKLYELAREGRKVDRPPRKVEIYSAEIVDIDRSDGVRVLMDVHCSKGTYIRTLCADIGERLGCGGHMSFLLRKRAGPFDINGSITLEELARLKDEGKEENAFIPLDSVFPDFASYALDEGLEKKFRNGMSVRIDNVPSSAGSLLRVYGAGGEFIAIGTVQKTRKGMFLKVRKFF
ncbi:MAG: tRNA pseudouridine(55) synthase TruB [Acetivibrionales bacterium]|jgi:tRNA pseudouridine55 synthase